MNNFTAYPPVFNTAGPTVPAVKRSAGSVTFLLATVTYTAGLILMIVNLLTSFAPGSAFYSAMRNAALVEPDLYSVMPVVQSLVSIFAVLFMIPTLLACIGFWVFFAAAKNNSRPTVSTGGLTLVQATLIIRLVGVSLLLLLLGILFIPICIAINEYTSASYYSSSYYMPYNASAAIIIAVLALLLVFLIFYIIYYAKALGTVASIKAASHGAFPAKPISMFVIVMNFIFAAFKLINFISTIFSDFTFISFLTSLFDIAFLILISIALLQLRRLMSSIPPAMPMQPASPMYAQPDHSYQPYQAPQPQVYQPQQTPQYTPQQVQQPTFQQAAQPQEPAAPQEKPDTWQDPQ